MRNNKKALIIIAALFVAIGATTKVALAHPYQNTSGCSGTPCSGSCVYSDCLDCPDYNGSCTPTAGGGCTCE